MKKIVKLFLLTLISFTFYASFKPTSVNAVITPDNNGNWYWGYESKLNENYYSDLAGITNKEEFIDTLAEILSDAKRYSYGSDGTRAQLKYLDEDPNDTSKVICLYTGVSFSKSANGNTWNQEHTWAKSHGFPDGTGNSWYAYSDLNHLRVTENSINSSRGNSDFFNVTNYTKKDSYGNYWTGSQFEPRDAVKGDVARIMMYMDVRYDGVSPNTNGVNLTLVNGNTSGSTKTGEFGDLDTLLAWHEADPVDDYERRRNDRVYEVQGNRNPFIDHPEYANLIYGTNYDDENDDKFGVTYECGSDVTFNYVDSKSYVSGDLITEPNVVPSKNGYSFEGWYSDSDLTKKWDFNNDKITGVLKLYPKFEAISDARLLFSQLTLDAKLRVKATASETGGVTEGKMTIDGFSGDGSSVISGTNNSIDLKDYANFDDELFAVTYHTNSNQYGYVGSNQIRFYVGGASGKGTSVNVAVKDDNIKITKITFVASGYDRVSASDIKTEVASDGKSAFVQNISTKTGGHAKISAIKIEYESISSSYIIESSKLGYRLQVSKELFSDLQKLDENLVFGIEINGEKHQLNVANDFVTFSPKDVNINEAFKVRAYVVIGGEYFYTETEDYSVKILANRYLAEMSDNDIVSANRGLLNYLAK